MKAYTKDELKQVLDKHKLWLETRFDIVTKGEMADLTSADLTDANLTGANLRGAYLIGAYLTSADLRGAKIDDKTKLPNFFLCPEKGSFTAFKKVRNGIVLELQIPASAKRTSSLVGRKCRASKAKVIKAHNNPDGLNEFVSKHNPDFVYKIGETVHAHDYSNDIRIECAPGIHFFITYQEALEY